MGCSIVAMWLYMLLPSRIHPINRSIVSSSQDPVWHFYASVMLSILSCDILSHFIVHDRCIALWLILNILYMTVSFLSEVRIHWEKVFYDQDQDQKESFQKLLWCSWHKSAEDNIVWFWSMAFPCIQEVWCFKVDSCEVVVVIERNISFKKFKIISVGVDVVGWYHVVALLVGSPPLSL